MLELRVRFYKAGEFLFLLYSKISLVTNTLHLSKILLIFCIDIVITAFSQVYYIFFPFSLFIFLTFTYFKSKCLVMLI